VQEPFERTTLIVGQQNSLHAADFAENLILGDQVVDDQLLLLVDPAYQDYQIELPRIE
jgi:hypothetical protein